MKVIHKFKLASNGSSTELKLKHGYKIVHSEYVLVEKAVYIWVEQTLAITVKDKDVVFQVVRSGDPVVDDLVHVATAVDGIAPEAYHIFKQPESEVRSIPIDYLSHSKFEREQRSA